VLRREVCLPPPLIACAAVSLYEWLLFLHVLTAFALVAAIVLYTFIVLAARRLEIPSEIARLFRLSRVGDALIAIGSIGVLVLGIWLAIEVDRYKVWDGWVIAAIVLWVAFGAIGSRTGKHYDAARKRARMLVAEGRDAPDAELTGMMRSPLGTALQLTSAALVLLMLVDMIYKPGA
jgi:uncharacterized membrane protein